MALLRIFIVVMSVAQAYASDAVPIPYHVPKDVFAGAARGPFSTGTFEELWVDERRDELTTSDPTDKRHLMIQIWYPAKFRDNVTRAGYALHREFYPKDEDTKWMDAAKAVRTTSAFHAEIASGAERYPVLIYNPGAGHPAFVGTFQTEFLASHGYVVVGIGHTDLTRIERFPDGYHYKQDVSGQYKWGEESPNVSLADSFRAHAKAFAEHVMPMHVQDIRFVLDRLQYMNKVRRGKFYQRLDLEHVGSLGWSLGGALSLQASRDEPRIKAAVNLDGWLYTDVQQTGTKRPVMQMHGGGPRSGYETKPPAEREVSLVASAMTWQLYNLTKGDWYDVTLQGAEHNHFSDRTLFEAANVGLMHPRLAHDIVNQFTLEFFDKYLRGRLNTPLLSGAVSYPDVERISSDTSLATK